MTKILIDTSAWIEFFRNDSSPYGDAVVQLVDKSQAVITGPVIAELLQGLKTHRERDSLTEILSILPYAEVSREDWVKTGNLLGTLRRQEITVPLTDALIATIAKNNDHGVLTLDRHFQHFDIPLYSIGAHV
ncbi:MAG: PIN domain-containing protein [Desulfuromonadales bacterium]|nr:PIN domain-containing protein [Desulfuromonadales bacterium]MBN2792067.1 PIN domain-containing protein [Desulfuromonadales bacterium]